MKYVYIIVACLYFTICKAQLPCSVKKAQSKKYKLTSVDTTLLSNYYMFVFVSHRKETKVFSKRDSLKKCFGERLQINKRYILSLVPLYEVEIKGGVIISLPNTSLSHNDKVIVPTTERVYTANEIFCNNFYNGK